MPLKNLFQYQIDQLRAFLTDEAQSMCIIQFDPDAKPVLARIVAALELDEESSHLLWGTETPFYDQSQYFSEIIRELVTANQCNCSDLPLSRSEYGLSARELFVRSVSEVADSIPDFAGSFAIVIDPEEIGDLGEFQEATYFLATNTKSSQVKYIVLDQREAPLLPDFDQYSERISIQQFHLSPEQIEKQIGDDLANDSSVRPVGPRRYAAMMGTITSVPGDYHEMERIQKVLNQALETGDPTDQALAYYNLGNAYFDAHEFVPAEECYTRAEEICLASRLDSLLAMVETNLGVALYWQGNTAAAMESLESARQCFEANSNYPGIAYCLDCRALILAQGGEDSGAEDAWLDALSVYDCIDNDALKDIRDFGRQDLLAKLAWFYQDSGQHYKIRYLRETA